jgi:uncharacterized protein (TIGR02145 family)
LYNWYSVQTGKLCPQGWRVPNDSDWSVLVNYLGGLDVAGGKLKQEGTTQWSSPNTGATNESGFTALPGGFYDNQGNFNHLGLFGSWWTSSEGESNNAWAYDLYYYGKELYHGKTEKVVGLSVRCIKN